MGMGLGAAPKLPGGLGPPEPGPFKPAGGGGGPDMPPCMQYITRNSSATLSVLARQS
jgi:hypothetical protein